MPSLVTSIIGGVQGANAAHDAASVISQQAGQTAGAIDTATQNAIKYGQSGIDQSNADIQAMLKDTSGAVGAAVGNAGNWVNRGLNTATGALQPYVTAGQGGLSTLASMLGPGGSLITPLTASQVMANDPGYQFRLQQGQKALETSASARGGLLGGAATKAALQYGQGFASNEYGNAWNRLMQQRQQQYNMLSGLAGMGETAGSTLGQLGMQGAGMMTNANMTGAGLLTNAGIAGANLGTNAALRGTEYMGDMGLRGAMAAGDIRMRGAGAQASGDIGAANAWNGMLTGIGNAANSFLLGGFGGGGGFSLGGALSGIPQGPNGPMMPWGNVSPWSGAGGGWSPWGAGTPPFWNPGGGGLNTIGDMDRSSLTMGGAGDADIAAGIYS